MHGYVYILAGGGFVKIGKTTRQPSQRVADFSPKLPFETAIVHVIECADVDMVESCLHFTFKSMRTRGEWFDIDEPDLNYIREGAYDHLGTITQEEADELTKYYKSL